MKYIIVRNADNGQAAIVASEDDEDKAGDRARDLTVSEEKPHSVYTRLGMFMPVKSANWKGESDA